MDENLILSTLNELKNEFSGQIHTENALRHIYATDASAYRELPIAVTYPKNESDLIALIKLAKEFKVGLIPRTAGTSLAGQVVGNGIIVDVSKYFTEIIEVNKDESWVRLQPGVIRDELNRHLTDYSLFFGPETSTANRAMLGGMVGNNSCGSNSVIYGSTRDHLIEVRAILHDGSITTFKNISEEEFRNKCSENNPNVAERDIYRKTLEILSPEENRKLIEDNFPKKSIHRRNTGYALDLLSEAGIFDHSDKPFNFCKLIAGSEGTLAFITEIKVNVLPTPPKYSALICAHFNSIYDSLKANLIGLKYSPSASELMDDKILERTKGNIQQRQNRFFVQGDPVAILVIELQRNDEEELNKEVDALINELKEKGLGYHFPVVSGEDTKKVWNLRKAGLGLLSNIPGDAKPAPVIEDTAVDVNDLPDYINEFNEILEKHDMSCVHYAHAGSGELHLRPVLNLKTSEGQKDFRLIAEEIATLVKKYKGSLSGEHGDGRLRAEFISYMVGEKAYEMMRQIKYSWDPDNIFNPGKIVDTPPMDTSLRYSIDQVTPEYETILRFDDYQGYIRSAELCNGSGDCRKLASAGGTMCPTYMATRDEKETTRARANILREMLSDPNAIKPFENEEAFEILDHCVSCKGCKSECPSNVDMAKLKTEFLHQRYKSKGVPLRSKMIANVNQVNKLASITPAIYNFLIGNSFTGNLIKKINGFATERSLPSIHNTTVKKWYDKNKPGNFGFKQPTRGKVILFCDEFTNYLDTPVGIKAIQLLTKVGYEVIIPNHEESGRAHISKGLLEKAKALSNTNISILSQLVDENTPLIGIEPSALFTFKDEYLDLCDIELKPHAERLAKNTYLVEEFLMREIELGNLKDLEFKKESKKIKLHGHCHQKALSSMVPVKKLLSLPPNYVVEMIPSGCCGMAGSFGYEEEHFELSMKIGETVLFPTIRKTDKETIIAAPGTSCRHQIKDGTQRNALHTIEVFYESLI
ncbi:FAD-binding and (Fe-S)-binding domain-containing protein [Marinigracilibium pacificum]|uniref:FAD-binding protein n=1 Tax=Marinigracilibium pacificum TaxID=2729599 RepID=A0A848J2X6_9BACT|nr:FAD-binding and (Fe-S)-binding domain-containing protein [Marinigracilibium pacificum]NMM48689.1 FAD-binding protein [Marinigracilibium pacificum]